MNWKYGIVTPVKDEERFLQKTIDSVAKQTILPQKWVIINDGSIDRTGEIIEHARGIHAWICSLERENLGEKRKPGGEAILQDGIVYLDMAKYDFFVRMDGDISFESDYFERIFAQFDRNPRLGIASGICFVPKGGSLIEEKHPRFHTRGPIKTYRMQCFEEIGGLESGLGWDTVDEIRANMLGWKTESFRQLKVLHHRKTQTATGALRGRVNLGRASYYLGYHPVFMVFRSIRNMAMPPYGLGGVYMLLGFVMGYIQKQKQINDPCFIEYLRKQQLNTLLGRETIWK